MEDEKPLDFIVDDKKGKYTRLAVKALIWTVVCLLAFIILMMLDSDNLVVVFSGLSSFFGFTILSISGFVLSILSYVKKEKDTVLKPVSLILNTFLFLIITLWIIGVTIKDVFLFFE